MSYIGKQPTKAALTASDIEDGIITAAKIEDGAVVAAEIASNAVTTAKINADAVTGAKIADDAINSEHYTDGSVDTAHIADANVTTAKIAGDAITAAKIADDAISDEHLDVTAITGQTAETSIADGDTILIHDASASALRKMTKANFVSGVGGTNTPNFFASITSDFSINDNTLTKIPFSNEVFDTGSNYDPSTNYRYTPGFVGKSFLACAIFSSNAGNNVYKQDIQLYKNGSSIVYHQDQQSDARQWKQNMMFLNVVVSHDADDYYEIYGKVVTTNSSTTHYPTGSGNNATFRNYFYGYKIIE